MRFFKLVSIALSISIATAFTANAQVNQNFAEYAPDIEAARSILKTERKILIMREMSLTPQEADAFWPLYDEYVNARRALGDERISIITDYAAAYGSLTNEQAREIIKRALKRDDRVNKLRKKYVKRFSRILPDVKVLRYFQLESKLDAIINFDLASQIPLAE